MRPYATKEARCVPQSEERITPKKNNDRREKGKKDTSKTLERKAGKVLHKYLPGTRYVENTINSSTHGELKQQVWGYEKREIRLAR